MDVARKIGISGSELAALGDRMLNLHEVRIKTGLSTNTIYRQMGKGLFPKRVFLSENTVRWRLSEIDDWLKSLSKDAPPR